MALILSLIVEVVELINGCLEMALKVRELIEWWNEHRNINIGDQAATEVNSIQRSTKARDNHPSSS
ncbi:hypothetical protein TWF281_004240 [Arthrobotrys megalospora]